MRILSPEQLATRCITISESYAFFRALFKEPYNEHLIPEPSNLISKSKFIIELNNSLSDRIIILWCSMFGLQSEDAHWKKLIPVDEHFKFSNSICLVCNVSQNERDQFWSELTHFRRSYLAHGSNETIWTHPNIQYCYTTASLLYRWIYDNHRLVEKASTPNCLQDRFEHLRNEAINEIQKGLQFNFEEQRFR